VRPDRGSSDDDAARPLAQAARSALGRPRLHLRTTTSTNDRARALAVAGAPHGTLVTATEQTAGRGRQGRAWTARAGSALLMSLVLRDPPVLLPLAAAVGVADAIAPEARIKWPNDVLLDGGKVAGILAEGRPQEGWAVLGVGLNVAGGASGLPGRAGTLGRTARDVEPVLAAVLAALADALALDEAAVLERYRARDALAGREVAWMGGHGRAAGVDAAGRLVVERAGGERVALEAGEVHLTDPAG
jgi:BirA family transcriptional regulator, biotin operon repressor / biotin---[acetyl-CoA-carboxylase] ligase